MKFPFLAGIRTLSSHSAARFAALRVEALEDRLLFSLTPHLLKDIGVGSGSSMSPPIRPPHLDIAQPAFVDVNGVAFFFADDGKHGLELWKSNGTSTGTVLV